MARLTRDDWRSSRASSKSSLAVPEPEVEAGSRRVFCFLGAKDFLKAAAVLARRLVDFALAGLAGGLGSGVGSGLVGWASSLAAMEVRERVRPKGCCP